MGTEKFYSRNELTEDQLDRIDVVRSNFAQLYDFLDNVIMTSREKSLYATKLEESCMWAVKAISREEEIEVLD